MVGESDLDERTDTQEAIMDATYRALRNCGYADLTIQAIADEFEKSKSLLYYHYDTKDEILIAFLEYMIEEFAVEETLDSEDAPDEQLSAFIDELVPASPTDAQREFQVALLELRSRALSKDAYREQFTRVDGLVHETLAEILAAGVEDGTFRDIDIEETAALLGAALSGAMLRRATTTDDVEATRNGLYQLVESTILAERR